MLLTSRTRGLLATGILVLSTPLVADTMHVSDDAHIDLANPGDNVGTVPNLVVSNLTDRRTGERLTFVSFELTPLPTGASLEQAWLRLWVGKVDTGGSVEVYLADAAWTEATLTAGNAPGFSGPVASLVVSEDDEGHYLLLDVTPEVAAWLEGSTDNFGFVIAPGADDVDVSFDSKENAQTSHGSELELVLGTASGAIDSSAIADNSVGTDDIEDGSVGSDDLADDAIQSVDIKDGTIGYADVDTSQLQRRVVGTCPEGSSIRIISESGAVTCEVDTDTDSGGDITSVTAGQFLVGGGTSGDVILDVAPESIDESRIVNGTIGTSSINENQVQRRVFGTCPAGSSIREVRVNGSVICDSDTTLDPGLFWQLGGNAGTNPIPGGSDYLGTKDDAPLVLAVNGLAGYRLEYAESGVFTGRNVIGGDTSNDVASGVIGATIAGGGSTNRLPGYAPRGNVVSKNFGTIGGGEGNLVDSYSGFIGGGRVNELIGPSSAGSLAIVGGVGNTIDFSDAEVIGGQAFIGGGFGNTITRAPNAVIGGGSQNRICGEGFPGVAGGSGSHDFIGGGRLNESCGAASSVLGGLRNVAGGDYSVILGGEDNETEGSWSLAAGRGALAAHLGAFVWADTSSLFDTFSSQRQNQVRMRAHGGVRFDVGDDSGTATGGDQWVDIRTQALNTLGDGNGGSDFRLIDTSTGAYLALGGGWVSSSDRNRKTDVEQVDTQAILDVLAGLPISRWRYKVEDESIRHIGPMAQDFQAAFGLGGDPQGIMAIDADGVALAAIQALHEVTLELERRTTQLEAQQLRLEALEAGLRAVEARLQVPFGPVMVQRNAAVSSDRHR